MEQRASWGEIPTGLTLQSLDSHNPGQERGLGTRPQLPNHGAHKTTSACTECSEQREVRDPRKKATEQDGGWALGKH